MTVCQCVEVTCPQCGSKHETMIWASFNAMLNPELAKALHEGRLNRFRCPDCEFEGYIGRDFPYEDKYSERKVRFWGFPG